MDAETPLTSTSSKAIQSVSLLTFGRDVLNSRGAQSAMSESGGNCCSYIPQRWIIILVSFFGIFSELALRVCLPIAITQMVVPSNSTVEVSNDDACPSSNDSNVGHYRNLTSSATELYDWSEYTQGILLSSAYWGQFINSLFSDAIIKRLGSKHTLGMGILGAALMNMLVPLGVKYGGAGAVILLRLLTGLFEGPSYPAANVLMAHWIPKEERSKAGSLVYSGGPLGTVFGMLASGLILHYSSYGWPAVFYFMGTIGIVAFLLNCAFCYARPSDHPCLSKSEARYLSENLSHMNPNRPPTPWRYILRSKPVWALFAVSGGSTLGFFTLLNDLPKYMNSVLKFSIRNNAVFSALPYLCLAICSWVAGPVADAAITRRRLTIGQVRKIAAGCGCYLPAIFLVAASYSGCNVYLAVACLTAAIGFMGFSTVSFLVNALDIAPNYAGALMGLSGGLAMLSGLVSPYVVGVLTPNQTVNEWRLVFWIVFMFYSASATVYMFFASGEVQEWNDPGFVERDSRRHRTDSLAKEQQKFIQA